MTLSYIPVTPFFIAWWCFCYNGFQIVESTRTLVNRWVRSTRLILGVIISHCFFLPSVTPFTYHT